MALIAVDGAPAVQRLEDGWIAAWVGDPEDPTGLAVDAPGAILLARRLVAAADRREAESDFIDIVERVWIAPPEQGASGRVVLQGEQRSVTFLLDWPALVALAEAANVALMRGPSSGEG